MLIRLDHGRCAKSHDRKLVVVIASQSRRPSFPVSARRCRNCQIQLFRPWNNATGPHLWMCYIFPCMVIGTKTAITLPSNRQALVEQVASVLWGETKVLWLFLHPQWHSGRQFRRATQHMRRKIRACSASTLGPVLLLRHGVAKI